MSSNSKPSDGPKCNTAVRSVLVMCLDVTRAADQWRAWWEVGLPRIMHAPNHRLHRAEVGVPNQAETDNFPRTPFYCHVKVSVTKVAQQISPSVAVARSIYVYPMKS